MTNDLRALAGDSEGQSGSSIKTTLPWDELASSENKKQLRKHIFALSKETDLLSREIDELIYQFDFDLNVYAYQAIVLRRLDRNLLEAHERLVPDMVGEDSFWRNYFYEIELHKKELGEYTKLGAVVDGEEQATRQEIVDKMYASEIICQPVEVPQE